MSGSEKKSKRFDVHVTKGAKQKGSKLGSVLVVAILLGLGGAAYYFWEMEDRLVNHISRQDGVAVAAAWAIYVKGAAPQAAYEPLLKGLESSDPGLRRAAVNALGTYKRRELVAPLLDVMADDADAVVRAAAVSALGENGNSENPLLTGAVRDALGDPHSSVRKAACTTVGLLKLAPLIPELIGALGDSNRPVKAAAKASLESFTEGDVSYEFNRQAWSEWYDGRR